MIPWSVQERLIRHHPLRFEGCLDWAQPDSPRLLMNVHRVDRSAVTLVPGASFLNSVYGHLMPVSALGQPFQITSGLIAFRLIPCSFSSGILPFTAH